MSGLKAKCFFYLLAFYRFRSLFKWHLSKERKFLFRATKLLSALGLISIHYRACRTTIKETSLIRLANNRLICKDRNGSLWSLMLEKLEFIVCNKFSLINKRPNHWLRKFSIRLDQERSKTVPSFLDYSALSFIFAVWVLYDQISNRSFVCVQEEHGNF
jgi:hypothetical protein